MTKKYKVLPPDVPCLKSAIPIACLLGKNENANFDILEATVVLISLNSIEKASTMLLQVALTKGNKKEIQALYGVFAEILTAYNQYVAGSFGKLVEVLRALKREINSAEMLQASVLMANTAKASVLQLFKPRLEEFADFLPAFIQFLLDFQAYSVFEMGANELDELSDIESLVMSASEAILKKDLEEGVKFFDLTVKYLEEKAGTLKESNNFGNMRIGLAGMTIVSCRNAAGLLDQIDVLGLGQQLAILTSEAVLDKDFSDAILSIFGENPLDDDTVRELIEPISEATENDPLVQYLCSGVYENPSEGIGYAALLAAILPFEVEQQLEHLTNLSDHLMPCFRKLFEGMVEYMRQLGAELPEALEQQIEKAISEETTQTKQVLLNVVLLETATNYIPDEERENYSAAMKDVQRLAIAHVFITATILKLTAAAFAQTATITIEMNNIFSEEESKKLADAFNTINTFQGNSTDIQQYRKLIKAVQDMTAALLPKIEQLIENPSLSLTGKAAFNGFTKLVQIATTTYGTFKELKEAFSQIPEIPMPIVKSTAAILLEGLYGNVTGCRETIAEQPDYLCQYLSVVKLESFYFFLLFSILPLPDTTAIQEDVGSCRYDMDTETMIAKMTEIESKLENLNVLSVAPTLDDDELANINVRDHMELGRVLIAVESDEVKEAIYNIIYICLNNPENRPIMKTVEANLRALIKYSVREHTEDMLTIEQIQEMSDEDIYARSIEIASILPSVAGQEQALVCQWCEALILRRNQEEVSTTTHNIIKLLTYSVPLRQAVVDMVTMILEGKDIEEKIQETAATFQIKHLSTYGYQPERQVHNLAIFLASSYTSRSVEYTEESAMTWLQALLQKPPMTPQEVIETINVMIASVVTTAVIRGCYNPSIMEKVRKLQKCLEDYTGKQTDFNYRRLLGTACQLPVTFEKYDQIDMTWVTAVCLIDPSEVDQLVTIESKSLYEHICTYWPEEAPKEIAITGSAPAKRVEPEVIEEYEYYSDPEDVPPPRKEREIKYVEPDPLHEYSDSFSYSYSDEEDEVPVKASNDGAKKNNMEMFDSSSDSDSDSDDVQQEIIYEDVIEEEEVGEPEIIEQIERKVIEQYEEEDTPDSAESEQVRLARTIETARNVYKAVRNLEDAAKDLEPEIVTARYDQLFAYLDELKAQLTESGDDIDAQTVTINQIITEVLSGDRTSVETFREVVAYFKQLRDHIQSGNTTSVAASELSLLLSNVQALCLRIENDPSPEEIDEMNPINKQITQKCREILNSIKNLGKAIEKVLEKQSSIPHEKSLARAIANTANTAQLFYLLIRMGEHEDDLVKGRCTASCRRLQSSVIDLTTILQGKATHGDIDLKKARTDLLSNIQSLIDACAATGSKSPAKPSNIDTAEAATQMAEKRLEADSHRHKCIYALKEAEAEVERLTRLSEGKKESKE